MIMTLYYVARDLDYQNELRYVAGPFASYSAAVNSKEESFFDSDQLKVVEQTITVTE